MQDSWSLQEIKRFLGMGYIYSCQTLLHLCRGSTAVGQEGGSRALGLPKCAPFLYVYVLNM